MEEIKNGNLAFLEDILTTKFKLVKQIEITPV